MKSESSNDSTCAHQMNHSSVIRVFVAVIAASFGLKHAEAFPATATMNDVSLSETLRGSINDDWSAYRNGEISAGGFNEAARTNLSRGLSPGGQRFTRAFPEGFYVDATKPGVKKLLERSIGTHSPHVQGYLRQTKYANVISRPNSPFELIAVEDRGPRNIDAEFDIRAREKLTGSEVAIESKEWKIKSQKELDKAKEQLDRIVKRARVEGVEKVIWVNRRGIGNSQWENEFKRYAKQRGASVYFNVSTGPETVSRGRASGFSDILDLEAKSMRFQIKARNFSKRGLPILGAAIEVGMAGSTLVGWHEGRVSDRELARRGGGLVGGAGGVWAGAVVGSSIGAGIGSVVPGIGTAAVGVIGGIAGGVAGGITGDQLGSYAAEKAAEQFYFEKLNKNENDALFAHVRKSYSTTAKQ